MLDKNLITSALSKPDETGNCFGSLEAAYKEAETKERNEMVEKEAEDIRQLIAAGVLERDSQGRLKKKMDDRISWVEDASYVAPPHNYQVSSDLISRTIAKCDGPYLSIHIAPLCATPQIQLSTCDRHFVLLNCRLEGS